MDKEERILWKGELPTSKESISATLATLKLQGKDIEACIEPVEQWGWYAEALEDAGILVHLVNPLSAKDRVTARKKSDRVDSEKLSGLLIHDYLPTSYLAPRRTRDLRELVRTRSYFVQIRTRIKNRIHSILGKHGLIFPYSNVLGKRKAIRWYEACQIREVFRESLNHFLLIGWQLESHISKFDSLVKHEDAKDKDVPLLRTIPGIGEFRALAIKAEVGDFARFPSAPALASYAGLVSSSNSSGDRNRLGHITKAGSRYLRWVMVETVTKVDESWGELFDFFKRIREKKGF